MRELSVRHIVMFDFSKLSDHAISELVHGFEALRDAPGILGAEWGCDSNPEVSTLGFTHCFVLTFESVTSRDRYLSSRSHLDYERRLIGYRSKILVFDYLIQQTAA